MRRLQRTTEEEGETGQTLHAVDVVTDNVEVPPGKSKYTTKQQNALYVFFCDTE